MCSQVRNSRTYPGNEEARSTPFLPSTGHWGGVGKDQELHLRSKTNLAKL